MIGGWERTFEVFPLRAMDEKTRGALNRIHYWQTRENQKNQKLAQEILKKKKKKKVKSINTRSTLKAIYLTLLKSQFW